jgi:23S rRNA pseudouridine2605 synthase
VRLNRYLAACGVCSRRAADAFIVAGRVRVDGRIVRELGRQVSDGARVEFDHVAIQPPRGKTYLVLHKPFGVVTTMRDPQGRPTVRDLLPRGAPRVVPVGRLDYDTSGVLLLTDDGDLANHLLHPRYGVEKTYRALIDGRLTEGDRHALRCGMDLGDCRTQPARIRVLQARGDRSLVELTVREGKRRQVRRMFAALGHCVRRLERVRFGPILLDELEPGKTRSLSKRELESLRRIGSERGIRRHFSNPTPLR